MYFMTAESMQGTAIILLGYYFINVIMYLKTNEKKDRDNFAVYLLCSVLLFATASLANLLEQILKKGA